MTCGGPDRTSRAPKAVLGSPTPARCRPSSLHVWHPPSASHRMFSPWSGLGRVTLAPQNLGEMGSGRGGGCPAEGGFGMGGLEVQLWPATGRVPCQGTGFPFLTLSTDLASLAWVLVMPGGPEAGKREANLDPKKPARNWVQSQGGELRPLRPGAACNYPWAFNLNTIKIRHRC